MKNVVLGNNLLDLYTLENDEVLNLIRRVRDEVKDLYSGWTVDLLKIINDFGLGELEIDARNALIESYCYHCKEHLQIILEFLEINFNRLTKGNPYISYDKYVNGIKKLIEDYVIPDLNCVETMCMSYNYDETELEERCFFRDLFYKASRYHWSSFEKDLSKVAFSKLF
jgi:hypothetical protein